MNWTMECYTQVKPEVQHDWANPSGPGSLGAGCAAHGGVGQWMGRRGCQAPAVENQTRELGFMRT